MSGQLVGEVLDAAEAGHLDGLSHAAFCALLAIAERCHHISRQGTVRRARIQAAIHTHNGYRTASRAIRELKDAGLIQIVKRGYKSHGRTAAPIYELLELGTPKVSEATECAWDKSECAWDKSERAWDTLGVHLDGSIDGSIDGRTPGPPKPETSPTRPGTDGRGKALARFERLNNTARSVTAYQIAQAFSDSLPAPIETGVLTEIGTQIDKCLRDTIEPTAIAAGIRAWAESASWHPSQIPKFVLKANTSPGVGKATQKALDYDAALNELLREVTTE